MSMGIWRDAVRFENNLNTWGIDGPNIGVSPIQEKLETSPAAAAAQMAVQCRRLKSSRPEYLAEPVRRCRPRLRDRDGHFGIPGYNFFYRLRRRRHEMLRGRHNVQSPENRRIPSSETRHVDSLLYRSRPVHP
jgi:hypothetical protein